MFTKKQIKDKLEKFLREDFRTEEESDRWIFCLSSSDDSIYDECDCIYDGQTSDCPCICHQRIEKIAAFIYNLQKKEKNVL